MMAIILRCIRRFRDDARGVSAVEFALIAPIMILFYFGMAELCQGLMAQKRTQHVASAVADLVAQTEDVTNAELADIFAVSTQILSPFPAAALQQRVSSVTKDATTGVAKVDWSAASNWTARTAASTVTLPANLIANGESVVMSEVSYAYASPFNYVMPSSTIFTKTYYLRPRMNGTVTKSP